MTDIRELERQSIRTFVQHCADAGYFNEKDVLDYGCGQQPYRDIVVFGGGRYTGYDDPRLPASTVTELVGDDHDSFTYDVVLCTQVVQYVRDIERFLGVIRLDLLREKGSLVITWPTNWPEVEKEDLFRYTLSGMANRLHEAGFSEVSTTPRAYLDAGDATFYLGHGAVAWK